MFHVCIGSLHQSIFAITCHHQGPLTGRACSSATSAGLELSLGHLVRCMLYAVLDSGYFEGILEYLQNGLYVTVQQYVYLQFFGNFVTN